jgi:hypothetical protein
VSTYTAVHRVPDLVAAGVESPIAAHSVLPCAFRQSEVLHVQLHAESGDEDRTQHSDVAPNEGATSRKKSVHVVTQLGRAGEEGVYVLVDAVCDLRGVTS